MLLRFKKGMGMGRSSSRIATRRIANYNGDVELDQLIEATGMIPNHHRSASSANANNTSSNTTANANSNDSSYQTGKPQPKPILNMMFDHMKINYS